jgi:hypothetical protein
MHQSVIDIFPNFSIPLEGKVGHFYLDIKGLVTIGVGCLVDDLGSACSLPMVHKDGTPASSAEIAAEWRLIKANQYLSKMHYKYAGALCKLRLTDDGVNSLMTRRLMANDALFRKSWPAWDTFPADAQLAISSLGWAMGAGFTRKFPMFWLAVKNKNWVSASKNCKINPKGNPGVIPRNKLDEKLLLAAAVTQCPEEISAGVLA